MQRMLHTKPLSLSLSPPAEVNVVNEWGQTPLILCVMNVVANPKDPRKLRQLKLLNWLIEQGATVTHRDKGG